MVTGERGGKKIAGVYIERRRLRAAIERVTGENPDSPKLTVKSEDSWYCPITPNDRADAIESLKKLAAWIHAHDRAKDPICGIGIGCYGPYVSLKRVHQHGRADLPMVGDAGYGKLAGRVSPAPFTGIDLYAIFRAPFKGNVSLPIAIHPDTAVAALGEAWKREKGRDDVVVAIVLDSGTGGGFVGGNRLFDTTLHPEMGRILIDVLPDDPLRHILGHRKEYLGILTGISAMIVRAKILQERKEVGKFITLGDLMKIEHDKLWPILARYIADFCWTCTVTLSPSTIVLGGPMANAPGLLTHVRDKFDALREMHQTPSVLVKGEFPAFEYDEIKGRDYINLATPEGLPFGLAGAVYMAWAATRGQAGVIYRLSEKGRAEPSPTTYRDC